ncbi:hypothetical protein NQ318_014992 [Aromia moschata]|uniref:Uncharacterized protein n=1 Tax=Aromia moschata TaxID=1265417 RepID=A0AAV8YW15_9CUCU|nr:hypothetical protein NQ318_014992 [Aromia moschata]
MLLPARCERVATSLNGTVSGDTFPILISLDKPVGRSDELEAIKIKLEKVEFDRTKLKHENDKLEAKLMLFENRCISVARKGAKVSSVGHPENVDLFSLVGRHVVVEALRGTQQN